MLPGMQFSEIICSDLLDKMEEYKKFSGFCVFEVCKQNLKEYKIVSNDFWSN